MRVLHTTHAYAPESIGGTEQSVRELAAAQHSLGDPVHVLTGGLHPAEEFGVETDVVEGIPVTRIRRADLDFDRWDQGPCPFVLDALDHLLERFRPDVVHVHHWIRLSSNLVQAITRRGVPVIATAHDLYLSCPKVFRWNELDQACTRPLDPASCVRCVPRHPWQDDRETTADIELYRDESLAEIRSAHTVLAPTQFHADLIARSLHLPTEQIRAYGLPYRPRLASPISPRRRRLGAPLRVGCWGVLSKRKGADLLLHATRQLGERFGEADVEVHLFGAIPDDVARINLAQLATDLPVRFHGPYDFGQIADADLDVAVIASPVFESFCYAVDEARELGVPVLAPDTGSFRERIGDRGLLFPRQDVNALAELLARLANDDDLRYRLAQGSAPQPPLPEDYAVQLRAIYQSALESPREGDRGLDEERRLREAHRRHTALYRYARHQAEIGEHCQNLERQLRAERRRPASQRPLHHSPKRVRRNS